MIFVHLYPFLLVFLAAAEILVAFDASPPALFGTLGGFAGLQIDSIKDLDVTIKVFDVNEEMRWTKLTWRD